MKKAAKKGTAKGTAVVRHKGGQPGNTNALRHGLKSGSLPKDAKYIQHQINKLRRILEAAVLEVKGQITLTDASCILSAIQWEKHKALCHRWLRIEGDSMKPTDRLTFSREIARASNERDRCIRELDLDRDPIQSQWDALDAEVIDDEH